MTTPYTCPDCGAPIEIDDKAEILTQIYRANKGGTPYIEKSTQQTVVAFCTGCEFAMELKEH